MSQNPDDQAATSVSTRMLSAAAEIVGGEAELARRLDIGEAMLSKLMTGERPLPDVLLLRAVDIILADRQSNFGQRPAPQPAAGLPEPDGGGL
jgi:hypothetical protein